MTIKMKLKKGDQVIVRTGRDKGRKGEIIKMFPDENRALVRGINMVQRHQTQTASQQGGIIAKEAPVDLSNLAIVDPKSGGPARIGYKNLEDGRKVRIARPSGEVIDV